MIILETPNEITGPNGPKNMFGSCVGAKLISFEVLDSPKKDSMADEAYCADEEIFMEFDNGKEMRIYLNEDGNISVYTD